MISFLRYTFSKRFLVCWLVWSVGVISFGIVAAIIPTAAGGSLTETLIVLLVYLVVVGILPPLLILVYSRRCYKEDRQREESVRLWQLGYGHVGSTRCRNLPKGASKGFKKEWKQWAEQNTRLSSWREIKREAAGEDVCAICLMKYSDSDMVRELPCKHTFHDECFNSCFASLPRPLVPGNQHRCPLCRTPLGPALPGALPLQQRQQSTTSTGPVSRRNSL